MIYNGDSDRHTHITNTHTYIYIYSSMNLYKLIEHWVSYYDSYITQALNCLYISIYICVCVHIKTLGFSKNIGFRSCATLGSVQVGDWSDLESGFILHGPRRGSSTGIVGIWSCDDRWNTWQTKRVCYWKWAIYVWFTFKNDGFSTVFCMFTRG